MAGPIKLSEKNKDFFEQVYAVVRLIPSGRVCSYGVIAAYLGAARGARMAGWAMNAAHGYPDVPAHRVCNAQGLLTGKMHFAHPDLMQKRLEAEGIIIIKDKVQNFSAVFWDPMKELEL